VLAEPDDDYARLAADLRRAVSRVCPAWLAARRDDIIQVALLRVMDARRRSDAELKPGYLRRVAWSALVDEIRAWRRRREVALEDEGAPVERPSAGPTPEQQVATLEISRGISDCLADLLEDRRLAVTLHLQGHTVPEASRLLAWSAKRTENLVYRGLADLRDCLSAKGLRP
jgi:RNA polymerase sigma-70 factor (ECF subfamily)